MNLNTSTITCNEHPSKSHFDQLISNLDNWLGLSLRTQLEHDRVILRIPEGAMRWPASWYTEADEQCIHNGILLIDVSGLSFNLSFSLSNETDLSAMKAIEHLPTDEESETKIQADGITLSTCDLRKLLIWLVQTLRPTEFLVQPS